MTALTLFCPESGRPVDSGIETDPSTFSRLRTSSVRVHCPECGGVHELHVRQGYLAVGRLGSLGKSLPPDPHLEALMRT